MVKKTVSIFVDIVDTGGGKMNVKTLLKMGVLNMSKKKYLAVLPALAILSLVGAGFSTWYFGTNTVEKDGTIDVGVTDYVDVGKINAVGNLSLVLDQTPQEDDETKHLERAGVHLEGSLTITYTIPVWQDESGFAAGVTANDATTNNIIDFSQGLEKSKINFTYELKAFSGEEEIDKEGTENKNILNYLLWNNEVTIALSSWVDKSTDSGNEKVYEMTISGTDDPTTNVTNTELGIAYKPDQEPKDAGKLKEMVEAVNNTELRLHITAKYTAPTGSD